MMAAAVSNQRLENKEKPVAFYLWSTVLKIAVEGLG